MSFWMPEAGYTPQTTLACMGGHRCDDACACSHLLLTTLCALQNEWGGKEHPFVTDVVDSSKSAPLREGLRMPSYIVMNRGESMQSWIRNRKPPPLMALWMLGEVSGQLAVMHNAGYVHRDIKPGNVLWISVRRGTHTTLHLPGTCSLGVS